MYPDVLDHDLLFGATFPLTRHWDPPPAAPRPKHVQRCSSRCVDGRPPYLPGQWFFLCGKKCGKNDRGPIKG